MALDITDPETEWLARQLADLTGESITGAVRTAVRDRLEREQRQRGARIDWALLRKCQTEIAEILTVDDRSADALLGFDEAGLPR